MKYYLIGLVGLVLVSVSASGEEIKIDNLKHAAQLEVSIAEQLDKSSDSAEIVQLSNQLAQVKLYQTQLQWDNMSSMVGVNRSFANSSTRDPWSMRQIASSYEQNPGHDSAATTYRITYFMGMLCWILGFFVLFTRLRYRY